MPRLQPQLFGYHPGNVLNVKSRFFELGGTAICSQVVAFIVKCQNGRAVDISFCAIELRHPTINCSASNVESFLLFDSRTIAMQRKPRANTPSFTGLCFFVKFFLPSMLTEPKGRLAYPTRWPFPLRRAVLCSCPDHHPRNRCASTGFLCSC